MGGNYNNPCLFFWRGNIECIGYSQTALVFCAARGGSFPLRDLYLFSQAGTALFAKTPEPFLEFITRRSEVAVEGAAAKLASENRSCFFAQLYALLIAHLYPFWLSRPERAMALCKR
jgi:hypothetical protein